MLMSSKKKKNISKIALRNIRVQLMVVKIVWFICTF